MAGSFAGVEMSGIDQLADDYGRWLIHGQQGSGKTTVASTIARLGKTLYVDLIGERGVRSFRGAPYSRNITVVRPKSITAMDDIFWELDKGDHDFKAVVVDSLTSAQKMAMRFMLGHSETAVKEIKQGTAPSDQRTWGQTMDIMVDLATFWYGLADGDRRQPMHVVMTAQTKIAEDEIGSITTRNPDVQRGAMSIVLATPDYIVYTESEGTGEYDDKGEETNRHVMRFGSHPGYRTKARIPVDLRGKLPKYLGRGKNPPDLADLSKALRIGGTTPSTREKAST